MMDEIQDLKNEIDYLKDRMADMEREYEDRLEEKDATISDLQDEIMELERRWERMKAFVAVIYIIDFILIIVTILNLERLDKEREKLNKKQIKLINECIDLNRTLVNKITKISIITESEKEDKFKIVQIKEVLAEDYQSNN